jgi:hypothetical protein
MHVTSKNKWPQRSREVWGKCPSIILMQDDEPFEEHAGEQGDSNEKL